MKMAEIMPVWGGMLVRRMPEPYRTQVRVIVSAPSMAAARRHLEAATGRPVTRTQWGHDWCDTGNDVELAVSLAAGEGVVLYHPETAGYRHAKSTGLGGTWLPWWADWPALDELIPPAGYPFPHSRDMTASQRDE